MSNFNQIRLSIGAWVSNNLKAAIGVIFLVAAYGFFPYGLDPASWIITFLRISSILLFILLLSVPMKEMTKTDPEKSGENTAKTAGEQSSNLPEVLNGKDLDIIRELSDQFYMKNRNDAEEDFSIVLTKMLSVIKKTFAAKTAVIFLINEHVNKAILRCAVSEKDIKQNGKDYDPDSGILGMVTRDSSSYLTNTIDDAASLLPYYDGSDEASSALAAPIFIDKEIIGVFVVDSPDKNAYNEDDIQLVETYGGVLAEIIVNYKNLFEFENSSRLFSSFYEVSRGLNSNLKFDEILDLLLDIVKQVLQFDRITILSYSSGSEEAEIIRVEGQEDDFSVGYKFPLGEGLSGLVMKNRKVLRVVDMEKGEFFMPRYHKNEKTNFDLRSFLAAPISYHDFCFGAISVESKTPGLYSERHERILTMLSNNFGVALERSYVLEQLESLATTDGLTKLFNYRTFSQRLNEEIERALRYSMKFSLLILDLDHFKNVNDTYGHLAGDLVLKRVAEAIKESTRAIDFIARYGGEEFAVILIEANLEDSMISAERIRKNIESLDINYHNSKINITVSIGAVEFSEDPSDPQRLIDRADKALYQAKSTGRNRIIAYNDQIESIINEK